MDPIRHMKELGYPQIFSRVAELLSLNRNRPLTPELVSLLKQAAAELDQFRLTHPESIPALRLLSECALRLQDLPLARQYISQAELLSPWDLEILIIAESIHEAQVHSGQSADGGEAGPTLSVRESGLINSETLPEKAMGLFRLGDMERAYSLTKLAYRLDPESDHRLMDILAVGSTLDPNRTREEFIRLEKENNPPTYLYLALGSICNIMGTYQESISWLAKGLKQPPEDPYVLGMLYNETAYVLAKQGADISRCIQMARTALEIFPNKKANGFIRDTLGVAYLKKGELDKAIQNLREAVSKDPTIIPRFHLALALMQRRDLPGALNELRTISASRPSLESPHVEESTILNRVQKHFSRLEDLLNLGGADDVRDALELLGGLI